MLSALQSTLLIVGIAASAIGTLQYRRNKRHVVALQLQATSDFTQTVITSSDPKFSLVGSEATVVRREEIGGVLGLFDGTADFGVTIYATNAHGECFIFKWFSKSARPFVKHVPAGFSFQQSLEPRRDA